MRCFVIATAAILACLVPTSGAFRPLSLPFFRRGLAKVMETKNPHLLKNSHLLVNQPHPDQGREVTSLRTTVAAEEGDWTQKRIHNTNWFRCSVIILAIGAAGKSPLTSALSAQAAATIHLLSFATWLGTLVYTTFVLGITMFKNLPRQTFGKLQAKLFPKYFLLSTVTIMLQLFTLKPLTLQTTRRVVSSLGVALTMTLLNLLFLEPYSTKIMMERYDLENQEGGQLTDRYKALKAQFGKMHGMSSLTNLIALCAGIAHGVALAATLI